MSKRMAVLGVDAKQVQPLTVADRLKNIKKHSNVDGMLPRPRWATCDMHCRTSEG